MPVKLVSPSLKHPMMPIKQDITSSATVMMECVKAAIVFYYKRTEVPSLSDDTACCRIFLL